MASAEQDIKKIQEENVSIKKSLKDAYDSLNSQEKKSFKRELEETLSMAGITVGSQLYAFLHPILTKFTYGVQNLVLPHDLVIISKTGVPLPVALQAATIDVDISTEIVPIGLLFLFLLETNLHAGTIRKFYGRFRAFYSSAKERAKGRLSQVV